MLQFDGSFKCIYQLSCIKKKTFVHMGKLLCSVLYVCGVWSAGGGECWVNPYGAVYAYSIITHFHKFSASSLSDNLYLELNKCSKLDKPFLPKQNYISAV